ncbi:MAG: glycosyltransferase [Clostridia bacterium]|nr:glycosyltransferase [Clostridia bacterium]
MNDASEYRDIMHLFLSQAELEPIKQAALSKNSVVVYPPTIDWSYMKQRPQQLMEQFSLHGFEVYYCNKTQSKTILTTSINPKLTLIHDNRYFISSMIPELKKQGKHILLWVSWSKLHAFLDQYQPDFIIYDYLDDFDAWKPYLRPMVDKADMVVTTSKILQTEMETEYPYKKSAMIPNGCDLNHFSPKPTVPVPWEFKNHTGPIITYSGAWARWVDHELVEKLALTFKDALVAIIGTEFGVSVPRTIPNLRYLGYKPYEELPPYLQYSTVCLIPFTLQPVTLATNPIKMYEYLASGRPVVSTDIPEARGIPSVHIGTSHTEFIDKARLILENQAPFRKDEVGEWLSAHTWSKRFEAIMEALEDYLHL